MAITAISTGGGSSIPSHELHLLKNEMIKIESSLAGQIGTRRCQGAFFLDKNTSADEHNECWIE